MGEDIKTSEIVGVGDSLLATPSARSAVQAGSGCAAVGEGASLVRDIVALYNAGKTGYVALGGGALLRSGGMRDSLVLLIKPSIGPITERTMLIRLLAKPSPRRMNPFSGIQLLIGRWHGAHD